LGAWGAALAVLRSRDGDRIANLQKNLSSVRDSGQTQLRTTAQELAKLKESSAEGRKALEGQLAKLDQIVNNLPAGVIVAGADGTIAWTNAAVERLTGWSSREIAGQNWNHVFRDPLGEKGGTREALLASRNAAEVDQDRIYCRTGQELNISSVLWRFAQGERIGWLFTARAQAVDYNKLRDEFVTNISHELRTPLTQIKGYNSLLVDGLLGPLTTEQSEALGVTAHSIDRLEQLINDLITYASTSKGELTLNLQFVSISAVIARVMKKSIEKAHKHFLGLSVQVPPDLPPVYADEEKLNWVLLQLVDNAIKFTQPGGRVTVSASMAGRRILLAVRDTGIGIPANRLADLFEPFQQLDGSTTRPYGGTGLGLALVRHILEAHGSQISVESHEGQGSTFSFSLSQSPTGRATSEE
jgi:PAS domain S-box-containing protein